MSDTIIVLHCSECRGPVGNMSISDISIISPENLLSFLVRNMINFTCDSCSFNTNNQEYERHDIIEHRGKPCYPPKADLVLNGWEAQRKPGQYSMIMSVMGKIRNDRNNIKVSTKIE